jgi:hypothetical protein
LDESVESIRNRRFNLAFSASSAATRSRKLRDHPRLLDDQDGKLLIRRTSIPAQQPQDHPTETIKPYKQPGQLPATTPWISAGITALLSY